MVEIGKLIFGDGGDEFAGDELRDLLIALDRSNILAITDAKGKITHVNDKFCDVSKYSREELIGQDHRIINSGYHSKEFFNELWRTIVSGHVWSGDIKNKAKDGSFYWVDTSIYPFMDANGRPKKFVAIRTIVTEQKHMEEQMRQDEARALYAEKMASLGEMAAGIAHEIGNPMAAIRGRMEMLGSKAKSGNLSMEDAESYSQTVIRLIDRTSKIIRGLRAYARDASSDPYDSIEVNHLVDDILEFCASRFQKQGIQLMKEGLDRRVVAECREAEIGQVLINLINNACDAVKDLRDRWISVQLVEVDGAVQITIMDSGRGVPKSVQEKMFEPFFTTKEVGKGTGLGLSIAASIMQSHGGSLRIDASSPHTTFQLVWPKKHS